MERPGKIGQKAILLQMHKEKFSQGFRDGLPLALGFLAVGFGIGISCRSARLNVLQGLLLSLLNNASAGEYGGITVMTEDAGYLTMVLMMLVVNARYMLMSCALSQRLAPGTGLKQRLLIGFDLTDELFGLAVAQPGYLDPYYYYGAMAVGPPGAAARCWAYCWGRPCPPGRSAAFRCCCLVCSSPLLFPKARRIQWCWAV